jgi:hypothetical protein
MATVGPITLKIDPSPRPEEVSIYVGYVVTASPHDIQNDQHYRETCILIGDDTGVANDVAIRGGTMYDQTTIFGGSFNTFQRAEQKFIPSAALNEDNNTPLQEDEIRAIVTLTPIPTTRASNIVKVGGPVIAPAKHL